MALRVRVSEHHAYHERGIFRQDYATRKAQSLRPSVIALQSLAESSSYVLMRWRLTSRFMSHALTELKIKIACARVMSDLCLHDQYEIAISLPRCLSGVGFHLLLQVFTSLSSWCLFSSLRMFAPNTKLTTQPQTSNLLNPNPRPRSETTVSFCHRPPRLHSPSNPPLTQRTSHTS